jgi:hypothetical protein
MHSSTIFRSCKHLGLSERARLSEACHLRKHPNDSTNQCLPNLISPQVDMCKSGAQHPRVSDCGRDCAKGFRWSSRLRSSRNRRILCWDTLSLIRIVSLVSLVCVVPDSVFVHLPSTCLLPSSSVGLWTCGSFVSFVRCDRSP